MNERALAAQWIKSPLWDGLWIFAGLWAPLLSVAIYAATGALSVGRTDPLPVQDAQTLAFIYLPLSVLHRISTTFSVLGTPILREEARRDRARYVYRPLAITLGCLVLAMCVVFHSVFAFMPAFPGELWAFFALAYVFILWERWHFCAQEFGVLSIYRMRAKQSAPADKSFDRFYTVVLMMGVNMVLFFCLGFPDIRVVLVHGTPLAEVRSELLEHVALLTFILGMGVVAAGLIREARHPRRSLPKLVYYLLIGAHTLLLYLYPRALGLFFLSYVVHHWLVAVGLFGRVGVNAYAEGSPVAGFGRLALRVVPLLVLLVLWHQVFGQFDRGSNLTPLPDSRWFEGASIGARLLAGFAIGTFFTLDFLHYYYDRCFYSFSNPGVRKQVAPLLLGETRAAIVEPARAPAAARISAAG